jgi:hypothetical protein
MFGDVVVDVSLETLLLSRELLEILFSGLGAARLQAGA